MLILIDYINQNLKMDGIIYCIFNNIWIYSIFPKMVLYMIFKCG